MIYIYYYYYLLTLPINYRTRYIIISQYFNTNQIFLLCSIQVYCETWNKLTLNMESKTICFLKKTLGQVIFVINCAFFDIRHMRIGSTIRIGYDVIDSFLMGTPNFYNAF